MNRRLPVTLIGGFFGTGKTSALHHFITEHRGGHLAMLVENPGALNLDAKAIGGLCGAMRRNQDVVVAIPNDPEISQVDWIAARLREFSEAGRFERVLIELAGTANAALLGECFGLLPGQPETFAPWAELHQIISVVDALDFYRTIVLPSQRGTPARASLINFQYDQIEGASLIVLNKCDLVDDAERKAATVFLRGINPSASIVETAYGEVPSDMISCRAGPQELGLAVERRTRPPANRPARAGEEPVLASALYRAYRPFHPGRFWDWYNAEHPGLLRVKGITWLATRNLLVGGLSRTQWQNSCGAAGIWWAALPREDWPEEHEALMRMQETWREPYGDRRQELVLIGEASYLSGLMPQLDACLLNAQEYAVPVKEWSQFPDPFPVWDMDEE
jgi:G3E family GTPase